MMPERMWWGPEVEMVPESELKRIQLERIKALIKRVYEKAPLYRKKFRHAGISPEDIQTFDDFRKIPFTKFTSDISPDEILSVDTKEASFIMSTAGTTGYPKPVYFTEKDLKNWGQIVGGRLAGMHGIGGNDVIYMAVPWPIPLGGFIDAGAGYIPFYHASLSVDNEVKMMEKMKVTTFLGSPNQIMGIFRRAAEMGIRLDKTGLRRAFLVGETWSEAYRQKMAKESGVSFYDYYAMAEVGPIAAECAERNGLHAWEDICVLETIDPDTAQPSPVGEIGEIVLTPLWRQSMPLIRYRTGDMGIFQGYQNCPCGRTFTKISRVKGRVDHMIRVGNARVLPIDVEETIHTIPELTGEYQIIVEKPGILDALKVKVECARGLLPSSELEAKVEKELERTTGANSEIDLVPYGGIPRNITYKAQRLVKA
jgi:phenylacetate-CoA ligase